MTRMMTSMMTVVLIGIITMDIGFICADSSLSVFFILYIHM